MPTYYCLRCSKSLSRGDIFQRFESTQTSGVTIAGHILNNPDLPILAVPLSSSSNHYIRHFCKRCGERTREILSEEELELKRPQLEAEAAEHDAEERTWQILLWLVFSLIIGVPVLLIIFFA
jgi:hypothetical protein